MLPVEGEPRQDSGRRDHPEQGPIGHAMKAAEQRRPTRDPGRRHRTLDQVEGSPGRALFRCRYHG